MWNQLLYAFLGMFLVTQYAFSLDEKVAVDEMSEPTATPGTEEPQNEEPEPPTGTEQSQNEGSAPSSGTKKSQNQDNQGKCRAVVDIAFLVDSSGSVKSYYSKEKTFVKNIVSKFGISDTGTHAGVVLFSSHGYIKTVINFRDHLTTESFNNAVERLPLYGYLTRIDKALKLAHEELLTKERGARPNIKKIVFLITDGRQTPKVENGKRIVPADEAKPFHQKNIPVYVIGIGSNLDIPELEKITADKSKVFLASNFNELISDEFVGKVSSKLCETAAENDKYTDTTQLINDCSNTCGNGTCDCCQNKSPVYINVFSGNDGKNYLVQGAPKDKDGNMMPIDLKDMTSSSGNKNKPVKDMNSKELADFVKDLLPYQQHFSDSIKELLQRAIATGTGKGQKRQKIYKN